MFYHIFYPLSETYTVFNLFKYITFRSIYATLTGLVLVLAITPWFIHYSRKRNIYEKIRGDGPARHHSKSGTPTMGGILIIVAAIAPTLLWSNLTNIYVWVAVLSLVLFGAIGFYDDYLKLRRGAHGLSARKKLALQSAAAFLITLILYQAHGGASAMTELALPFFKSARPDLGLLYFPFAMLVIVGASNAVNLTDGLDGLAIGPLLIAFSAYAMISYLAGHMKFAEYLAIPYARWAGENTIFCAAMVGASLGFLWHNCHPASIFMGNVGSTALGGALGAVALMAKQELALMVIGGIFVVEALSVLLQVFWYRTTGRRIFLMAPLHHHFEKKGWPESQVIIRFWIVALALALISLSFLKIR